MSAEILRRAAALMRERAEATVPNGRWVATSLSIMQPGEDFDIRLAANPWPGITATGWQGTAEHIASWHPAVALLVAQSLSFSAQAWRGDHKCQTPIASDEPCDTCDGCFRIWTQEYALTVARAYLGEQP